MMRTMLAAGLGALALVSAVEADNRTSIDASVTIRVGTSRASECDGSHIDVPEPYDEWRWFQRPSGIWVLKRRIVSWDVYWERWSYGGWSIQYAGHACAQVNGHWRHHPGCHCHTVHVYKPHHRGRCHHAPVCKKKVVKIYTHEPRPRRRHNHCTQYQHRKPAPEYRHESPRGHHVQPPVKRKPVRPVPGAHQANNRVVVEKRAISGAGKRTHEKYELSSRPVSKSRRNLERNSEPIRITERKVTKKVVRKW